jgi:hypothetical protein
MQKLAGQLGTQGMKATVRLWASMLAILLVIGATGAMPALGQGLTPGGPVDFGTVPVGGTPRDFAITFSATVATTIQSVNALTNGVTNEDFTVVTQTCTGTQVPPQSCTVEVAFAPTAPGLRKGALSLTDSTGAVVNRVFLHGIGQGPQLAVMPPSVSIQSSAATISPAGFETSGLAIDGAGATYFNDYEFSRVLKRAATGNVVSLIASVLSVATSSMAIDGAGTLYLTSGTLVYSLVPGSLPVVYPTGSITLVAPRGVAVDGLGYVYISDASLNEIVRVAPDGSSAVLALTGLSTPLNQPYGLAIDANNNLYIADFGNNRVVEAGLYTGAASVLLTGLSAPQGVAVDASGSVIISDTGNRRLVEVPASGAAFPVKLSIGALGQPVNLAVTAAGDFELADATLGLVTLTRSTASVVFPTATHITVADTADDPESGVVLNSGNVPLVLSVPASGNNPVLTGAAFSLDASSTCPTLGVNSTASLLAVGAACTYGFDFTPTLVGLNTGSAVVSAMVAGGAAFTDTITLTGTGISNTATFTVVASPTLVQPGSTVGLTVTALSASGNVDTTYRGTITFTATDATAAFPAGSTYTFTAADAGVHVFSAPAGVVFHSTGTFTVSVTDGNASGTSNPVKVVQANGFTLVASPSTIGVGGTVSLTVTATFNGAAVSNYTGTVTFSATDPSAKFLMGTSYTFTAADAGSHTFTAPASGVQFNTPGVFTISATDGTYTGTSNPVTVLAVDSFSIVATPTTVNVGDDVGYTVTAMFRGAVATNFTGTVTFTTSDAKGKFLGVTTYTFTVADQGSHTFPAASGIQFNTPGTQTITATDGGLTGTSNGVTVVGVNGFVLIASPSSTAIGAPVSLTIESTFNGTTIVPTYTGTVTFTATDATAKFLMGTSYTFTAADQGSHTFPAVTGVQFNQAGVFTISATDGTYSGTSNQVTVGAANGFTLVASPSTININGTVSLTVEATYNGTVEPNYTGTVTFSATDPAAKFLSGTSYTFTAADQGQHTFPAASGVQFNTAGTFTISATDGKISGTSNTVTVVSATGFTVTVTPSVTAVGAVNTYTVTATLNGATATQFTGTVTMTSTDTTARFLSGMTLTFTAADAGTKTFTAPATGVQFNHAGVFTITATSGSGATQISGTSNQVTVVAANGFSIVASPTLIVPGGDVGYTISATYNGTAVAGYVGTITFSSTDPAAKFLSGTTYTFTPADNGSHTFTAAQGVQLNTVGTQTISATDGTSSGTSNQIQVVVPNGFTIVASPNVTTVGVPVGFSISATYNGAVIPYVGTVTFTATDATAKFLSGTSYAFTAADAGTHTFAAASGVQFNTPGTFTISATNGTASGTSNTVLVNPIANGFTIVASPTTTTIGTPVGFTVAATYNGVVVTGYTGTVTFSATDPAAKFLSGTTYTFTAADGGTHTFAAPAGVQFNTVGTFTISATDGTRSGTSNAVTVLGADSFMVTAAPTVITAGNAVSFTVTAMLNGAVATNFTGTVTFTSTDPAAKFLSGTTYTFTSADQGMHTFTVAGGAQLNTVGNQTLTASDATVSGTSNVVQVVTAGSGLVVTATPSATTVGTPVSFTVTAQSNGTTNTGFTGTVSFTTTDSTGKFLSGTTYTFTVADAGTHAFTAPASGVQFNQTGVFTVTATSGALTGTSNPVTVGSSTTLVITATPSAISVGQSVGYTITAQQSGATQTGFTGTVTCSTGDPRAVFISGASYTFTGADAGTHTFSAAQGVTYNTVGTYTIVCTTGTGAGLVTGTSNQIQVTSTDGFLVTATPASTPVNSTVSFTVSAVHAGAVNTNYTGTVRFSSTDGAANFLSGTSYTFTASDKGTHTFTAPASGVTFHTVGQQTISATDGTLSGASNPVTVYAATGLTLVVTPATTTVGTPVGFTISATYNGQVVTNYAGTVTFSATDATAKFLGGTSYTFTAADNGAHTFPPATGVQFNTAGVFTISATDGTISGTSNSVTVTIPVTNPSTVSLSTSANPALITAQITLTATITGMAAGGTTPGGTVVFMDGTQTLGTVPVTNGTASLTVTFLTVGPHLLTAVYTGDANFAGGTSAVLSDLVEDFALSIGANTSSTATVLGGHAVTYEVLVQSIAGPLLAGPVTLSLTGAPTGTVVSFVPATIAAGQPSTLVLLTVTPPVAMVMAKPVTPLGERLAPITVSLLFLPLAWFKRRKMVARLLMLALMILPFTALTGCLSSAQDGYYSSSPQTYTLTITGTSGTLFRIVQVQLTVQ